MTHEDTVQAETFAERRRLAELLAQLTQEQWGGAFFVRGLAGARSGRARDHAYRMTSPEQFHAGLEAHGFDFNRFADHEARETTKQLSDADLLAIYSDNAEHPWLPPRGGPAGALSHDLIHGLDITER